MNDLWQDCRYAVRMLTKNPGFTAVAVLVLALGIGANTAIFSLVNGLLFRPLPVESPSQLVYCYSQNTERPDSYRAFSYPNYIDLREQVSTFSSILAHDFAMVGLTEGDSTSRVFTNIVSSNYFDTFGVDLFRGRTFLSEEEVPGASIPVVMMLTLD